MFQPRKRLEQSHHCTQLSDDPCRLSLEMASAASSYNSLMTSQSSMIPTTSTEGNPFFQPNAATYYLHPWLKSLSQRKARFDSHDLLRQGI